MQKLLFLTYNMTAHNFSRDSISEDMMKKFILFLTVVFISSFILNAQDADRSKWRGDGAGIIKDDNWNPKALNNIKIAWNKELGEGYSAACVVDGKVLITGNNF